MKHTSHLQKKAVGIVFVGAVLLAYFGMIQFVETENVANDVTVSNVTSTIDTVSINTSSVYSAAHMSNLDLSENTTTTYYAHVQFTDANGCGDIINGSTLNDFASFRMLPSNMTIVTACNTTPDPLKCYEALNNEGEALPTPLTTACTNTCTVSTTAQVSYTCPMDIAHFANSGEWSGTATIFDSVGGTVTSTVTTTINVLTALDINTTSVAYGNVANGATSSEQSLTITNTGNDTVDFNLSSTDLTCDVIGSIPVSNQEVSTTTGFVYGAGTNVSSTPTQFTLGLSKQVTTSTASTDSLYWQLQVPAGVSGTCSSTATITAVSN